MSARLKKKRRMTSKEEAQKRHIVASERKRGRSLAEARTIGYKTVMKRRKKK